MTTKTEFKWEDIDSLEQLKLGDELEYTCPGKNKEFKYWGKVIDIQRSMGLLSVVHMEGDWMLVPSSLSDKRMKNKLTRKVAVFQWPEYIGAVVKAEKNGEVCHYVRVAESGHLEWVVAETAAFYATWELEILSDGHTKQVLGRGY